MTIKGCIAYFLFLPAIIVTIAYLTELVHEMLDVAWSGAYLIAINAVAFVFYAYDKAIAGPLKTLHLDSILPLRVPENALIWLLAFPGGTLGSIIAMFVRSHKIGERKREFRLKLLRAYALQFALLIVLFVATVTWNMAPVEWLETIVEAGVGIILDVAQILLSMVGI